MKMNTSHKILYFDAAANTPLDKKVLKEMLPYMSEDFMGNSFATHTHGMKARDAIEETRSKVASILHVKPEEIYFNSGATEGNNWIIRTLANIHKGGNIVCSATEHDSVIRVCKELELSGQCTVTYVDPTPRGIITSRKIQEAIKKDTFLCCVMSVNNEIGCMNPVYEIGKVCKKAKVLFLCDCTQLLTAGCKKYFNFSQTFANVDYFTFSGHKIYGPLGTGILVARADTPVYPFISGGAQEWGARGGTSNTPGIVGIGKALELLSKACEKDNLYYRNLSLRQYMLKELLKNNIIYNCGEIKVSLDYPDCSFFMSGDHPGIISLDLSPTFNSENLAKDLSFLDISVSAGSACDSEHSSGDYNPSHVLVSLKKMKKEIKNTVRVSFTKQTTKSDIDLFVKRLVEFKKEQEEK